MMMAGVRTCLVVPGLAEVHDDLRGAGVQRVEVGAVVLVQTLRREVVNTPQPVHQLPGKHKEN